MALRPDRSAAWMNFNQTKGAVVSYKVTQLDEKGRDYSIIRECDGVSIPRDPDNPSFCEFLKWHNEQKDDEQIPRFRFKQPATFWCSEICGGLIDHFKTLGCMLSCELNEEGQVIPIYKEHRDYANGQFYQLCSTSESPGVDV
jgi:hypothetical protein